MRKSNKKKIRRFRSIAIVIIVVLFLSKTWIYNALTFYDIVHEVQPIELTNKALINQVDKLIASENDLTVNQLIEESLKMTSKNLEFGRNSKSIDPNELVNSGKTHCVGYASMANAIINYGLEKMDQLDYKTTHWRGKIYFLGIEITNQSEDQFFKDHDFVEITNTKKNERLRIDPSLYEFMRIGIMKIDYAK